MGKLHTAVYLSNGPLFSLMEVVGNHHSIDHWFAGENGDLLKRMGNTFPHKFVMVGVAADEHAKCKYAIRTASEGEFVCGIGYLM